MSADRADPDGPQDAIRVDHFIRGKLVTGDAVRHRSRDLGVDFTTPEIDLDALVAPRSELPPLLDVKTSEIIDFLVDMRRADGAGEQSLSPGGARAHRRDQSAAAARGGEPVPARAPLPDARRADVQHRDELRQSGSARRLGRADRLHGQRGALRAFPPRMVHMLAGQFPDRVHLLDRAGRAGQGDQRLQDAVERSLHLRRDAAHHGGRRSRPSGRPLDVGGLLARRRRADRAHALPPAVFRQDRRLGRRRCDQQRHQVPRARVPAGFLRSQDLDLDDRVRGLRIRCRDRRDRRGRGNGRRGVQPGSLPRQPLHLRRRRSRRDREVLRPAAGTPRCRPRDRLRGRASAPRRDARGDRDAADDGRRVQGLGQVRRPRPGDPDRASRSTSTRATRRRTSSTCRRSTMRSAM